MKHFTVCAFFVLTFATLVHAAIIPIDGAAPDGRTYAQLTTDWWRWAMIEPAATNPLTDRYGDFAARNQHGPVWFLAPGIGTDTSYTRDITVPAGQYLFFPVLSAIAFNLPDETATEADLRAQLADFVGKTSILYVTVDGQQLNDVWTWRLSSPPGGFSLTMPADNIYAVPEATYAPAVTDGFWLLLDPLTNDPGLIRSQPHTLTITSGTGDPSIPGTADLYQSVTYNITIIPEPAAASLLTLSAVLLLSRRRAEAE